ncbi:MAG: polysaccharide deacetylase family protein [Anaerolineae bacterium]|nr:polysaccharide deacetylase family protein [Anaerolineae bacterium]
MEPNPLLKRLGLSPNDRVVILHADDVGMCQAGLEAYADMVDFGLLSSASTMVPCAWFPATAAFCRENAAKVDMGVHITFNSEWPTMRWGPIATRDPASGLLDADGYFPASVEALHAQMNPEAGQRELQAQVERALAAGIDVTHIDSHMFAVSQPAVFQTYIQIAMQYRIPPLLVRGQASDLYDLDRGESAMEAPDEIANTMNMLQEQGLPVLDYLYLTPLNSDEDRLTLMQRFLPRFAPGITYLIFHPAKDTPEMRALAPDWKARAADYASLKNEAVRKAFQDAGIHIIGWRVLRDLMREVV